MIQLQFPPINSGMDALDSKRPALGNEYLNEDISIDHFIVKNYTGTETYGRGKNLSIIDGCSFSGLGKRTS